MKRLRQENNEISLPLPVLRNQRLLFDRFADGSPKGTYNVDLHFVAANQDLSGYSNQFRAFPLEIVASSDKKKGDKYFRKYPERIAIAILTAEDDSQQDALWDAIESDFTSERLWAVAGFKKSSSKFSSTGPFPTKSSTIRFAFIITIGPGESLAKFTDGFTPKSNDRTTSRRLILVIYIFHGQLKTEHSDDESLIRTPKLTTNPERSIKLKREK